MRAVYAPSQPKTKMQSVVHAGDYADKTEAIISNICSDVLGIERVPPEANIMSYGGGSLAGVRVFARIRKELGVNLWLSALFQAPTVRQLAALVREAARDPAAPTVWSPLVRMAQGTPARRPIFCVHGAGGNVVVFKPLVDCLPHDLPVFGIQARGVDGRAPFQETIEEMAATYVAAVRAADPSGPYRLTGYSGGGVIAYEMAQQIVRDGGAVELLAMFDTLAPAEAHAPLSQWDKIRVLKHRAPLFLLGWPIRHSIFRWRNLRIRLMEKGVISDTRSYLEIIGEKALEAFMRAQARYKPSAFDGNIVLFRASEAELMFLRAGWTLGWSSLVRGNVEVHEVYATHQSVFQPQSIEVIASVLNAKLNALDAVDLRQP
jgi:thioesterase domain-containing protein/acyl carrier protein